MMPDTAAYYHAAYVVVAILYGGYVVSLWLRSRRVRDRRRALLRSYQERSTRVRP